MLSCLDDSDEDVCFHRGPDCHDVEGVPGTQLYDPVTENEECNVLLPTASSSSSWQCEALAPSASTPGSAPAASVGVGTPQAAEGRVGGNAEVAESPGCGSVARCLAGRVMGTLLGQQSPKRRRILGKQSDDSLASPTTEVPARVRRLFGEVGADSAGALGDWTALREFMRQQYVCKGELSASLAGDAETQSYAEKRVASRAKWACMNARARLAWQKTLLEEGEVPEHLQPIAEERLHTHGEMGTADGRVLRRMNSTAVLLTWNGQWGVIDDIPESSHDWTADSLAAALQQHAVVKFLWVRLQELCCRAAQHMNLQKHACSIELCTASLESKTIRVHCHAFWASNAGIRFRALSQWEFGKSVPHRRQDLPGTRARGRSVQASHFAGLYYVCAPKIGSIHHAATHLPNKDFTISPEWINTLFQLRKLHPASAKAELAKCRKDVARHVANVDTSVDMERQLQEEMHLRAVRAQLETEMLPRRRLDIVDNVWLKEQATVRRRQRFLVLTGKTKCGKSLFALSLRGAKKTLAINCGTSLQEPDLRHYVRGVHECIVFEEAHAVMVIRCKQLFQAAPEHLSLATSQTQCHAYRVCVHGVLLVITSNVWLEEVAAMSPGDQEWLHENSYVVQVTEPLWLE